MAKPKIAVTGAGGLVGSNLVEYLASKGYQVLALVRSDKSRKLLLSFSGSGYGSVHVAFADILEKTSLTKVLSGVDVIVHAAGAVDPYGKRELIFKTNVEGTFCALSAAKEAGLKQFIHISSLSVITGQDDQFKLSEDAQLRYCGEPYADSKVDAEKLVLREIEHDAIKVTVLRPGFIYGPRERSWMPRLIDSISEGHAMLIDGGLRQTNVIYVENLSRAIELSLLNERAYGQVFNLTDGDEVTKKQLFDAISKGLALPPVSRTIPRPVAKVFCELVSSCAPVLPQKLQGELARYSRAAFRLAAVNQGFDISKAERELKYVNRVPFEEGMSRTLDYFRKQGDGLKSLSSSGVST